MPPAGRTTLKSRPASASGSNTFNVDNAGRLRVGLARIFRNQPDRYDPDDPHSMQKVYITSVAAPPAITANLGIGGYSQSEIPEEGSYIVMEPNGGSEINAVDFGLVGDDATDNTTAWNTLYSLAPTGATIFIPPGTYRMNFTSLTAITKTLHIIGSSTGGTILKDTSASGDGFRVTAFDVIFEHIFFTATAARTSGATIRIQAGSAYCHVHDCKFDNYSVAWRNSGAVNCALENCQGTSTVSSSIAIMIDAGNVHYVRNCVFNNASVVGSSYGIYITGDNTNVVRLHQNFIGTCAVGLLIEAPTAKFLQIISATDCDFDTCTLGGYITKIGTGAVSDVDLTSTWFGTCTSHGLQIVDDSVASGSITNIRMNNCLVLGNGSSGAGSGVVANTPRLANFTVIGGHYENPYGHGIFFGANVDDWMVLGASLRGNGLSVAAGYGVVVTAGTATKYLINNCNLRFNKTGGISDGPGLNPATVLNVA